MATRSPSPRTSWTTQRWSEKTLASQNIVRLTPSNPAGSSGRRPRETTSGSVTAAIASISHAGRMTSKHRRAMALLRSISVMMRSSTEEPATRLWCKCYSHEMTDVVKPKRAYRSTRRAGRMVGEATGPSWRRRIRLFQADGYSPVTMPAIALEAGVAVETIYRGLGARPGLFAAVIDAAVAGGRGQGGAAGRGAPRDPGLDRGNQTRAAKSASTPAHGRGIHRRSGQLLRALAAAAGTDSRVADAGGGGGRSRCAAFEGQARFVQMLRRSGSTSTWPLCRGTAATACGRSPRWPSTTCSWARVAGRSSATSVGWPTP